MPDRQFTPGFRLSASDILVLIIALLASVLIGSTNFWLGSVIAFVVSHFFLFCNIFRVSRLLEFLWAGAFLVLGIGTVCYSSPGWPATFALTLAVTIVVVVMEMRKPSYHGIMWQRVNPQLREWWDTNADA